VRLAINDALNALPKEQTHVVWLAYFAGQSNGEIARRLGISVGAVQHRLKLAFEQVSAYVEHGRTAVRTAVFALLGWLSLRRLLDLLRNATDPLNHPVMTGALVAAGATAAVLVGTTATPVIRPSIEPAVIATAPAPAAPPTVAATTRAVSETVNSTTRKLAPGAVVPNIPGVPPLPIPSPPPLPLPSPPPLP
jgi:DNA-binding Lrp family transcriptional regulator